VAGDLSTGDVLEEFEIEHGAERFQHFSFYASRSSVKKTGFVAVSDAWLYDHARAGCRETSVNRTWSKKGT
jgi:hypothetical protein